MELIRDYWVRACLGDYEDEWLNRLKRLAKRRSVKIVRFQGRIRCVQKQKIGRSSRYRYLLHLKIFFQQAGNLYIEERILPYVHSTKGKHYVQEKPLNKEKNELKTPPAARENSDSFIEKPFNRRKAVQYAERWWNEYNPDFKDFPNNCTNFVSQCLLAGEAKMWGFHDRETGWWYTDENWSFSWSVAHSLRWLLSSSKKGLKGKEVFSPKELLPGDIICYDFEGDGRWDHQAIVVVKDDNNEPLVNAHTNFSRHRYWSYEDSLAWTENTAYKFFQIDT